MPKRLIYRIVIIKISLLLNFHSFSQNEVSLDSLKQQLIFAKTYNDTLSVYYQLSFRFKKSNIDSSEIYLKKIIRYSIKYENIEDFTDACLMLSHLYKIKGQYSQSIQLINSAINIIKPYDQIKQEGLLFLELGELNRASTHFEEAISFLTEANIIFMEINDSLDISKTYNRLAAVYFEDFNYEKAEKCIDSSFEFLNNKTELELRANNYEILGAVKRENREFQKASKFFSDALNINSQLNNEEAYINNLINLQLNHFKMKDYKTSILYGEEAILLSEILKIETYTETTSNFLAYAYFKSGNFKKAFLNLEKSLKKREKIFNEQRDAQIVELNTKYNSNRKADEIEDQKNEIKQRRIITYAIAAIAIFLFIAMIIFFIARNKLKKTNVLLSKKNKEIQDQRKQIEDQKYSIRNKAADLLVLNMRMKETDDLKVGLTAMLVHDLKNPINNIINLTKEKEINSFAYQMLNIVNNILDVQKYENTRMELDKKEHSLYQIIIDAIQEISLLAEHKNIRIENKVSKKYIANIDIEIIQRVFVNLMTNSIKYTPSNGHIVINCEIPSKDAQFINLSVTDNGIGIQKSKIDTIFNKFNQVIAKKSGHARSTGLGLTFCKMAVEAHGGEISVRSVPDHDTTFIFNLPLVGKYEIHEESYELIVNNKLNIELTDSDKAYLKEYVVDLKDIEVYDVSNLKKITKNIKETVSDNVKNWKEELNKAIYNCNEGQYREILRLID